MSRVRVDCHLHTVASGDAVGAAVLDRLEAADRTAELVPDLRVLHRHVQRPLRPAP